VTKALFKNKLIIFRNESQFTAEAQRTLRQRRDKKRRGEKPLAPSLRDLGVLCASAVNCEYRAKWSNYF
jgi:hypothetical protein